MVDDEPNLLRAVAACLRGEDPWPSPPAVERPPITPLVPDLRELIQAGETAALREYAKREQALEGNPVGAPFAPADDRLFRRQAGQSDENLGTDQVNGLPPRMVPA